MNPSRKSFSWMRCVAFACGLFEFFAQAAPAQTTAGQSAAAITPGVGRVPDTGTISAGSFRLQYRIEGTGPPALVIGSALYYPRAFSPNLRQHLRLVFLDHRGFAPSPGPVDVAEFALGKLVDDMERARQELGLGRIAVIGHSGHAFMALEYAKKYPANVSHVIMIGMGPDLSVAGMAAAERYWQESVSPERKAVLAENLRRVTEDDLAKLAPSARFVGSYVRNGPKSWFDPKFDSTPLWAGVEPNMDMFGYVWGQVFRDIDITPGLTTFDRPVFLALGRYDFIVPPPSSWDPIRPKFRDLTIRVFERSGHTPQFEEPALFDAELLGWMKQKAHHADPVVAPKSQPAAWTDPSPHQSRFVTVNGVSLHTLDWGGTGEPLILIPGSTDNPHVFDGIAPQLTDRFRVVGYARRDNGRSERKGPYDVDTLVEDLRQLLDHFGFRRASLAGWSLAGHEMTRLASLHPGRVKKLVYLDAGYDWSNPVWIPITERIPGIQWSPSAEELRSFVTFKQWFVERSPNRAAAWSPKVEAYARDFVTEEPDGTLRFETRESGKETLASYRRNYGGVKAPALAIYAPDFVPMNAPDATTLAALQRWAQEEWVPWQQAAKKDFEQGMSNGQVHLLAGGDHMTFLFTQEAEIVRLMRRFLLEP